MSTLCHNPEIDEYARMRAENEEDLARAERAEAMRRQREQTTNDWQSLVPQSLHFERNFAALTGRRANADKPRFNANERSRSRNADFYGFYYGQL